nr:ubiquitin-like protein ATG12 [Dasypus novemcinctus]
MIEDSPSSLQFPTSAAVGGKALTGSPRNIYSGAPFFYCSLQETEACRQLQRKNRRFANGCGKHPFMKTRKWVVERTRNIQGLIEVFKKFLQLVASEQLFIYVN